MKIAILLTLLSLAACGGPDDRPDPNVVPPINCADAGQNLDWCDGVARFDAGPPAVPCTWAQDPSGNWYCGY